MDKEHRRQLIHISGIIFVVCAQITGGLIIALYSFMIAGFFLTYSVYMRNEKKRMNALLRRIEELETQLREFTLKSAREEEQNAKFLFGPFWFFFGIGTAFLVFPLSIASAAGAVLAVGDALSNLIGRKFGRHKIRKGRTIEGSLAFFISSFIAASFFAWPLLAIAGALSGMLAEISGIYDDNLTIPLFSGAVMYALALSGLGYIGSPLLFCGI